MRADLDNWKEALAILCTYNKEDRERFSQLTELLGDRLHTEKNDLKYVPKVVTNRGNPLTIYFLVLLYCATFLLLASTRLSACCWSVQMLATSLLPLKVCKT